MADYQVIGDKSNLGTKPEPSPSQGVKPVDLQRVGTHVELSKTAMPSPTAIASKGDYQVIGTQVKLNHTPDKMVGNNSMLTVSERSRAASEVGSIPQAKVTRP